MEGLIVKRGLSGNALKIIALFSMTLDHVGVMIFPQYVIFRILGRVAMPVFAFMIAEGCTYTRRKAVYFGSVFGIGLICVIGYLVSLGTLYLNILITYSFSIAIIYGLQYALRSENKAAFLIPTAITLLSVFLNYILPYLTGKDEWSVDYGFFGTLLPVMIYLVKDFRLKLVSVALGLTLIAINSPLGIVQWWSFASLLFLIFYDGTRGKFRLKYLFYIYYPLHIVAIYGVSLLL